MKTHQFELCRVKQCLTSWVVFAFAVMLLAGPIETQGQAKSSSTSKKPVAKRGYLSKLQPSGLRFASPPRPPVSYLPPLPITYDPQPVFTPEFAMPGTELPVRKSVKVVTNTPTFNLDVPITDLSSIFTGPKQGKIPTDSGNQEAVSPQMLVRFFENGNRKTIEIPVDNIIGNPLTFRVPVNRPKASGSATYELK